MADLNLHPSMIERACEVYDVDWYEGKDHTPEGEDTWDRMEKVIKAAFEGVPMTNYSVGTLLGNFDLVILVKELESRAAALVARREPGRDASEGFETSGHTLTVNWGEKPTRYIKSVTVGKLDPPTVQDIEAEAA